MYECDEIVYYCFLDKVCYVANLITLHNTSFCHRKLERDRKSARCIPVGLEKANRIVVNYA